MYRIMIPRSDITSEEVANALRQGLGARYHVLVGLGSDAGLVNNPGLDNLGGNWL
jgi:hypothetical protein